MTSVRFLAAFAAVGSVFTSFADFDISLDLSGKPIKDVRESTCGPEIGYAGCAMDMSPGANDTYFFERELRDRSLEKISGDFGGGERRRDRRGGSAAGAGRDGRSACD